MRIDTSKIDVLFEAITKLTVEEMVLLVQRVQKLFREPLKPPPPPSAEPGNESGDRVPVPPRGPRLSGSNARSLDGE